ncbi:MAG: hypothetical protein QOD95_1604 [Gammaproteobacteria bacterium]|nr:hypothetical protein [Gammaproteobacteria bacterium]
MASCIGPVRAVLIAACCLVAVACGGGGGGGGGGSTPPPPPPPTNNVVSVIVDEGPTSQSVNTLFTSVTVCVPGSTTNCQTIDHIQVDTGSYGLRLLAPVLTVALPVETLSSGNSLAQCTQFVDGFSWGPIALADVQIAGETAKSLPVQVIGDSRFATVPAACSGTGTAEDTVSSFGANGILGIGPFELDCGDCDTVTHGLYFACATATTCTDTTVPNAMQVPNPVTHFAADNNGSMIDLPAVAAGGAVTLSGSLIFGIDTQSNNQSGTQTVLTVDGNGELAMTFNGQTLANSFIDSGSNGIYFADSNIATCTTTGLTSFYCPGNTLTLGLSIQGQNGVMVNNLTFGVGNAQTMLNANPTFNVFPQLAGQLPAGNAGTFDYGLAFFYGKRVAVAVEGNMTSVGTGPYIAF